MPTSSAETRERLERAWALQLWNLSRGEDCAGFIHVAKGVLRIAVQHGASLAAPSSPENAGETRAERVRRIRQSYATVTPENAGGEARDFATDVARTPPGRFPQLPTSEPLRTPEPSGAGELRRQAEAFIAERGRAMVPVDPEFNDEEFPMCGECGADWPEGAGAEHLPDCFVGRFIIALLHDSEAPVNFRSTDAELTGVGAEELRGRIALLESLLHEACSLIPRPRVRTGPEWMRTQYDKRDDLLGRIERALLHDPATGEP